MDKCVQLNAMAISHTTYEIQLRTGVTKTHDQDAYMGYQQMTVDVVDIDLALWRRTWRACPGATLLCLPNIRMSSDGLDSKRFK